MNAVVLFSGGLDSTVTAARAIHEMQEGEEVNLLSFEYGSVHNQREHKAALDVVRYMCSHPEFGHVRITHSTMIAPPTLFAGMGSALMGFGPVPEESYEQIRQHVGAQPTVVPFRNAYFLTLATIQAIKLKASRLYIGVHSDDSHNGAYPDCTPEFIGAMTNAIKVGSDGQVSLIAPYVYATKADIVADGHKYKAPMQLTYSCYNGREKMCGKCATCQERLHAFEAAGFKDGAEYEN